MPRWAASTCPGPTPCKADHCHRDLEQSIPAPNAPHLALNPNPTPCTRRPPRPEKQQAWPALSLSVPGAPAHMECSDTGPFVRAAKGPQLMRRIINISDSRPAARPSLQAQQTPPLGEQGASGGPDHLLATFCPLPAGAQLAQCRVRGFLCPPSPLREAPPGSGPWWGKALGQRSNTRSLTHAHSDHKSSPTVHPTPGTVPRLGTQ